MQFNFEKDEKLHVKIEREGRDDKAMEARERKNRRKKRKCKGMQTHGVYYMYIKHTIFLMNMFI